LRTVLLTTLKIRRLRADMIEVYKILRGFEGTEEVQISQRRVGATRGHDFKLFKKQVNLDAGKFSFGNRVCDAWKRLPGWVVSGESVNEFKGNVNNYLRDGRGFK